MEISLPIELAEMFNGMGPEQREELIRTANKEARIQLSGFEGGEAPDPDFFIPIFESTLIALLGNELRNPNPLAGVEGFDDLSIADLNS
ncbi:hypothetical protein H3C67_02460 [Candidatus Dojkabacteria bacterium]|uniref:Uncharacterized protein n=2 Tax=Candidatus Dojkabacteria TaxID=74243 RepID=A0A136KH49_9BACT|nr:MAG: hypothetical protein UZ20_WS6002000757 [candidate division WS6 bacterium OLB21]MBW7953624.1 hypothetical protein [Candidatus Dojkabacteria bacterium]